MTQWMRRAAVTVLAATLLGGALGTAPAVAASDPVDPPDPSKVCWYEGKQYSPGAIIIAPDGTRLLCHNGIWIHLEPTDPQPPVPPVPEPPGPPVTG